MAYSQFHDGFWSDPEIRKLSPNDKLLLAWFITNPYRHYSGVYFFEYDSIRKQTGLMPSVVEKGIDTLSNANWIQYNRNFSIVWVRKMAKHEVKKSEKTGNYSEKQIKGIANHLKTLHKCPLISEFLGFYADLNIPYQYGIRQEEEEVEVRSKKEEAPPLTLSGKSTGKKTETLLPDDFGISEQVRAWAEKKGFDRLDEHLEAFIDYARARGKKYVDWDAAFKNAIRGNWGKIGLNGGPPSPDRPTGRRYYDPNCPKCKGKGAYPTGEKGGRPTFTPCKCGGWK